MKSPATTGKTIKLADHQAGLIAAYGALPATGFVRLADLRPVIGLSDSSIWRRVKARTFPQPLKLSERVTVWRVEAIRQWLDEQGQGA